MGGVTKSTSAKGRGRACTFEWHADLHAQQETGKGPSEALLMLLMLQGGPHADMHAGIRGHRRSPSLPKVPAC